MKQTAVQFFALKAMYLNISPKEMHHFLKWFEQAKEMERQQIEYSFDLGFCEGYNYAIRDYNPEYISGEQYFKENYK
jgi:hypothetical protein